MITSRPVNPIQLKDEALAAGIIAQTDDIGVDGPEVFLIDSLDSNPSTNRHEPPPEFQSILDTHSATRNETHAELVERYNAMMRAGPPTAEARLTIIEEMLWLSPRQQIPVTTPDREVLPVITTIPDPIPVFVETNIPPA